MQRQTQFVAALLMAHAVFAQGKGYPAQRAAREGALANQQSAQPAMEARELPIEEYAKLGAEALLSASAKLASRIKNPRFSRGSLDPAVLAVLDEQGRYLRRSGEPERPSPLLPAATANRGLFRPVSLLPSCLNPLIFAVNGRAAGPVFTPRLGDNHYRIEGCGFGSAPGEVRLEGDSRASSRDQMRPTTLQLERPGAWSEGQIDVRLDPRLAGLPDATATLVVRLADGRRVEFHGCRFVAVRGEPVVLKTVPASWVRLNISRSSTPPIQQFEYVSPPTRGAEISPDAATISALVIRSNRDMFEGGEDTYDFSALNPGWTVESIQVQNYNISCPGDVTRTTQSGDWNTSFGEHGFTVRWASDACSSFIPPMFRFSMAASEYAVKVWVSGPIGTEPVRTSRGQKDEKTELGSY